MVAKKNKRDEEVLKLRKQRKTQSFIADKLGVTRQRVQQIEQRLGLSSRREERHYKVYPFVCCTCKEKHTSRTEDRKFCSRECFSASRRLKLSPQEAKRKLELKKEKNRERSRKYYHTIFKKKADWKDIVKKRNTNYNHKGTVIK